MPQPEPGLVPHRLVITSARLRPRYAVFYPALNSAPWHPVRPAEDPGWLWLGPAGCEVKVRDHHVDFRAEL